MNLVLAGMMLDPFKFSGAWYEVASYKAGFPPLSELACMDTRALYEYSPDRDEFDVQIGCRRLDRSVSSIRAVMKCPSLKCTVRYPSASFVQPSTFRVLDTDYDSYVLVEGADGAKGPSPFVQIFSRYPRPGNKFIEEKKKLLKNWGYDPNDVHVSPVTIDTK